jgi:hypothetical protein
VDEADSDSDKEIVVEEQVPITGSDARQGFLQLRKYCEENGLGENFYSTFDQLEDLLLKDQLAKMKQPKISDFFTSQ